MAHHDGYIIAFKYKICLRQVDNNCTSKNVPLGLTFSITADDDSEGAEITKNPWRLAVNAASGRWCVNIVVFVLCILFVVSRLTKKKAARHGSQLYLYKNTSSADRHAIKKRMRSKRLKTEYVMDLLA